MNKMETKEFNRNQRLKEKFESRPAVDRYTDKYTRKIRKKTKNFYNFIRTRYSSKELTDLYNQAEINCCWAFEEIPKDMVGNKVYKLSMHLREYRSYFLFPLEDLPLMLGDGGWGDKIASWRFKLGR